MKGGEDAIEKGKLAIESGINHIDTAQLYKTEPETGEAVRRASVGRDQVYVTSKRMCRFHPDPHLGITVHRCLVVSWGPDKKPIPLDEVRARVEGSLERLGFIPDLYLIHNPFIAAPGELRAMWKILEDLKDEGKLKSIGVSNFRPQDLGVLLADAKYKPVVNQVISVKSIFCTSNPDVGLKLEFHPYTLAHLGPVLALQKEHGIITESYGSLTPLLRHPTGGPLKPVLEKIAARLSQETGKPIDATTVLLLWTRAQNAVVVSASGNPERIAALGELARSPQLLTESDVAEISNVGKTIHFRFYVRFSRLCTNDC